MSIKQYLRPFSIIDKIVSGYSDLLYKKLAFSQKVSELRHYILTSNVSGVSTEKYCEGELIVSLTTYDKRLHDVDLAIESIMQGSLKPNRIILWLAEEFKNKSLPRTLQLQVKRGLEIRFCDEIRSYKKLIPTLKCFPNAVIVTIDDDAIYNYDMLELLVNAHLRKPKAIVCHWLVKMTLDHDNKPNPCRMWENYMEKDDDSHLNTMIGVGGVLYPPNSLDSEVLNKDAFMALSPYADDLWFYCMALKKGTPVNNAMSYYHGVPQFIQNDSLQVTRLSDVNMGAQSRVTNDSQLKAICEQYDLYTLLRQ